MSYPLINAINENLNHTGSDLLQCFNDYQYSLKQLRHNTQELEYELRTIGATLEMWMPEFQISEQGYWPLRNRVLLTQIESKIGWLYLDFEWRFAAMSYRVFYKEDSTRGTGEFVARTLIYPPGDLFSAPEALQYAAMTRLDEFVELYCATLAERSSDMLAKLNLYTPENEIDFGLPLFGGSTDTTELD